MFRLEQIKNKRIPIFNHSVPYTLASVTYLLTPFIYSEGVSPNSFLKADVK